MPVIGTSAPSCVPVESGGVQSAMPDAESVQANVAVTVALCQPALFAAGDRPTSIAGGVLSTRTVTNALLPSEPIDLDDVRSVGEAGRRERSEVGHLRTTVDRHVERRRRITRDRDLGRCGEPAGGRHSGGERSASVVVAEEESARTLGPCWTPTTRCRPRRLPGRQPGSVRWRSRTGTGRVPDEAAGVGAEVDGLPVAPGLVEGDDAMDARRVRMHPRRRWRWCLLTARDSTTSPTFGGVQSVEGE